MDCAVLVIVGALDKLNVRLLGLLSSKETHSLIC